MPSIPVRKYCAEALDERYQVHDAEYGLLHGAVAEQGFPEDRVVEFFQIATARAGQI
jgi:hypothetical protein